MSKNFYGQSTPVQIADVLFNEGQPEEKRYSVIYMPDAKLFLRKSETPGLVKSWTSKPDKAAFFAAQEQAYIAAKNYFVNVQW